MNNDGSYTCECKDGYVDTGKSTGVSKDCLDINECEARSHDCGNNQECENLIGSFLCSCIEGFVEGMPEDDGDDNDVDTGKEDEKNVDVRKLTCLDLDECSRMEHGCHPDATCINAVGSYSCKCNSGFSGDGISCENSDECVKDSHNCHVLADCHDTKGSYECKCRLGYDGDGITCGDFDECKHNMHDCDLHASCKDTIGSYKCQCNTGYAGSGLEDDCHNIDECKLGTDDCNLKGENSANCVDNDGSFDCFCKKGYANNTEGLCVNKNECLIGRVSIPRPGRSGIWPRP